MWKGTYKTLFIFLSSFYTSEHCLLVKSHPSNQESVKTIGLAKKYLNGNTTEMDRGKIMTTAAIAGSILGIGMTALPNELSSREINSPDQLNISSLLETKNNLAVFGMLPEAIPLNEAREKDEKNPNKENSHLEKIHEGNELSESESESDWSSMMDDADGSSIPWLTTTHGIGIAANSEFHYQTPITEHTMLMTGLINNNQENTQDIGIDTEEAKRSDDIKLANKKAKVKIYAAIACSILVVAITLTAVILKFTILDKETSIKKLIGPNDTISIPATQIIDHTTGRTTEQLPKTEQDGTSVTSRTGEAITVQNTTNENISPPVDICEQYGDINSVCSYRTVSEMDSCMVSMHKCMKKNQQPDENIQVPANCTNTVDNMNIREHFYGEFTKILNKEIQLVQNVTSLDCAAAFDGFNTTIQAMLSRYECGSNDDFANAVLQRSLEACDAFKEDTASIYNMCLTQKHIMQVRRVLDNWPADVMGSTGDDMQRGFVNCTEIYDRDYFTKYLSAEKSSDKDEI